VTRSVAVARTLTASGSRKTAWLTVFSLAVYFFLYTPVVTMLAMSFNDSISITLPWGGFTTKWYAKALSNSQAWAAFGNSVKLGLAVGILSSIMGLLTALAFRRSFRGKAPVLTALLLPLLTPGLVLAVGQTVLWNLLGQRTDLWTSTLLGHLVYTVPFAFIMIYPRVHKFDPNIEAAAMDLGAGPFTAFRTIVLPRILPGVIASVLFCFTLSLDEFVRTMFLIGPQNTLPMYLWSIILTDPSPETNAIATLSVCFSLTVVGMAMLIARRGRGAGDSVAAGGH
jgi:spermidine/putrescine transport system permease protein